MLGIVVRRLSRSSLQGHATPSHHHQAFISHLDDGTGDRTDGILSSLFSAYGIRSLSSSSYPFRSSCGAASISKGPMIAQSYKSGIVTNFDWTTS